MRLGIRLLIIVAFTLFLSSPRIISKGSADGGANHQGRNTHFGVSGGNVNDITKRFCCSGTLGALVTDGTTNYVLSNNHVLGLSGKAGAGDDISQPGLIDNGCRVSTVVADFTTAPALGSNVDAAIAQLRPGLMDASGFIEDIGPPSSMVRNASVGLSVAKSGRTTGFTTGTVSSINTNVSVQYQQGCGQGKKFVVSYTNQVVIGSSTFSAGGDSGSLIVTNDSNHQPVALLFAGSSTTTIGNPIGEVLTRVGQTLGRPISFGGAPQGLSTETLADNSPLPQEMETANVAKERHVRDLMSRPGVIGVGVGRSAENPFEGAVVVYVDRAMGPGPDLPRRVDNVRVQFVLTDQFVAR
jgi:hypothetical protein